VLTIGALTFLAPAALMGAVLLPVVWLLLRLIPPAIRRLDFPAARLLFNLPPTERTSARTPPWLMALRLLLLMLALIGLADPILTASRNDVQGPLIVVMDNGWASAVQWEQRQRVLRDLLERAERHKRQAALITTAADASTTPDEAPRLSPAREVLVRAAALQPQPWGGNRTIAAADLRDMNVRQPAEAVWIADGVATPGDGGLIAVLESFASVTVVSADRANAPLVLSAPERNTDDPTHITLPVRRVADAAAPSAFAVRAFDKNGYTLARSGVVMDPDATTGHATLEAPLELSNRIVRFDVEGQPGAGATVLADTRWQRRPVGVASTMASGISAPLLEDAFYIRQALSASADVHEGDLNTLMSRPLSVLFMASGGRILESELDRVTRWVEGGGILVRFAGSRLMENVDPLLPVRLRAGGRSLGGTLSWSEPARLGPFPETSPFKRFEIPTDVTIGAQVLAEPSPDLPSKTWAKLSDGTPLITAERKGQGWIVLFHVTAAPDWSNLPLSGLFVDMLRGIVDLSAGVSVASESESIAALPPLQVLDGFGQLVPPGPMVRPLTPTALSNGKIGPELPPGLYGSAASATAVNLSTTLAKAAPVGAWPANADFISFTGVQRENVLKPYFLCAALLLLLLDLVISFVLRGLTPVVRWRLPVAGAVLLVALAAPFALKAAEPATITSETAAAILETRLAYVETGDATIDRIAGAGLGALTRILAARTSAELADPTGLDLKSAAFTADTLSIYPLIYWRVSANQPLPSPRAAAALSTYMRRGGMVVFDAPEHAGAIGGGGAAARLEDILRTIDMAPLVAMDAGHVLTRSFYLLKDLPGRFTDTTVYVDKGSPSTDGVAAVIVGGNDWAAAWARDDNGLPYYPTVPGGEMQREQAYRAGVNMVMYALTGNYKSDQVHLPAIMQRLTQ